MARPRVRKPVKASLRSWSVSLIRNRAHFLGFVDAANLKAAEAAAVKQFSLADRQRRRLVLQEAATYRCPDLGPQPCQSATLPLPQKGLVYSYPSPSDCIPRRDWNETSPSPISAFRRRRCRVLGRVAYRLGASLSDAAGASHR